MYGHIAGFQTL